MKNKDYYMDEIKNVSKKMLKEDGFKFAIVADSHLDNSILDTICNIKSVDSFVDFECLIHLGDIMCGNLPRNITMEILTKQLKDFRSATKSQRFYPVQGNHDGYYEQRYNSVDTIFDDEWYSLIRFINDENNAKMVFDKPYYYIDYKKEKIRLIMLCDFRYDIFYDEKKYAKLSGIDDEQIEWLANDALLQSMPVLRKDMQDGLFGK